MQAISIVKDRANVNMIWWIKRFHWYKLNYIYTFKLWLQGVKTHLVIIYYHKLYKKSFPRKLSATINCSFGELFFTSLPAILLWKCDFFSNYLSFALDTRVHSQRLVFLGNQLTVLDSPCLSAELLSWSGYMLRQNFSFCWTCSAVISGQSSIHISQD